jgi:hypothetical protein
MIPTATKRLIEAFVQEINAEYEEIVEAERKTGNLPRAISIGEKLIKCKAELQHGEWQDWLKEHCPQISYETAALYMRFASKRDDLEKAAAAKSVTLTDLTITEARELLATPKPKSGKGSDTTAKTTTTSTDSDTGGDSDDDGGEDADSQSDDPEEEESPTPEETLAHLAPDELFAVLKDAWSDEQIETLSDLLRSHVASKKNIRRDFSAPATATH